MPLCPAARSPGFSERRFSFSEGIRERRVCSMSGCVAWVGSNVGTWPYRDRSWRTTPWRDREARSAARLDWLGKGVSLPRNSMDESFGGCKLVPRAKGRAKSERLAAASSSSNRRFRRPDRLANARDGLKHAQPLPICRGPRQKGARSRMCGHGRWVTEIEAENAAPSAYEVTSQSSSPEEGRDS
jgi:hypothetical protein